MVTFANSPATAPENALGADLALAAGWRAKAPSESTASFVDGGGDYNDLDAKIAMAMSAVNHECLAHGLNGGVPAELAQSMSELLASKRSLDACRGKPIPPSLNARILSTVEKCSGSKLLSAIDGADDWEEAHKEIMVEGALKEEAHHRDEAKTPRAACAPSHKREAAAASAPAKLVQRNVAVVSAVMHHAVNPHNHDGKVSIREIVAGDLGMVKALFSEHKRATALRIGGEMVTAVEKGDHEAVRESTVHYGRAIARTTGSQDLGHAANLVVGGALTKGMTGYNLLSEGKIGEAWDGFGRFARAAKTSLLDSVGFDPLANAVRPLMQSLRADKQIAWVKLVDGHGKTVFDGAHNGILSVEMIIDVMRNNKVGFAEIDHDGDGKISLDELRAELYKIAKKNHGHVVHTPDPHPAAAAGPLPTPHVQKPTGLAPLQQRAGA